MVRVRSDKQYEFVSLFNTLNGNYVRVGRDDEDPFRSSYPELVDIGIMGSCENGRVNAELKM